MKRRRLGILACAIVLQSCGPQGTIEGDLAYFFSDVIYFIRPIAPEYRYVGATLSGQGNHLYDLQEKKWIRVPQKIDLYPTPDGRLLTGPGIYFYKTQEALKQGAETPPLLQDLDFPGAYQSIGMLEENLQAGYVTYRAVVSNDGLQYKDYKYDLESDTLAAITPTSRLCPNIQSGPETDPTQMLQTPMISRNGRLLQAIYVDNEAETSITKVYSINDPEACLEVANLGMQVGKADFSPDGTELLFSNVPINPVDPQRPKERVFSYSWVTHQFREISTQQAVPFAYPAYFKANQFIYVQTSPDIEAFTIENL